MDANTANLIQDGARGLSSGIAAAWPVIGPLAGILFGAYLTGRSQRRKWIADNKKEEYRELLSQLMQSFNEITAAAASPMKSLFDSPEAIVLMNLPTTVILDRLFIAREMQEMDILKRWATALKNFQKNGDRSEFNRVLNEIRFAIVDRALRLRV